jgi:hypothetical protein
LDILKEKKKTLKGIFDPIQNEGQWRSWYTKELYDLLDNPNYLYLKRKRQRRAGHVQRMDEMQIPRRL